MSKKILKREFEGRYFVRDYDKLWENVEKIVKKKGKIHYEVDYIQNEVQEFWRVGIN